ncbi:ABC transporter substrate-binding protein [Macrococcoides canis]|uniref:ABC transporter substrate-binding protein n=1 Tax=Macrococcoides canis TaxID=1855823 RepID=UPI00165EA45A|nr:ABC transporter substrate-binding protein [Macrococcus canis]MCO4097422.1 SgrR family transcriptional regulator [Macrococcus canis]UTH09101.1 SgrR family transcriptional regulator [Macrococcus canis]
MMIDSRLLELKDFIQKNENQFLLIELADYFSVSERQMGRLLKKWQEENLIEYIPASGRGNAATLNFVADVEKLVLNQTIKEVPNMKVEELQSILELPFEEHSKHKLQNALNEAILDTQDEHVVVKYGYLPKEVDPANINTIEEAQIVYQAFESLYKLTSDGKVKRNLLSYDEWIDNELHLYLKKEVHFSNGDMLIADDVKNTLERLKGESLYTKLYSDIVDIKVVSDFKLILVFEKHPKFFEYRLAARYSVIYKDIEEGNYIGTGPYYISDIQDDMISLGYNAFYRGAHPDIQKLFFTKKDSLFRDFLQNSKNKVFNTNFGNEFILFNPFNRTTKAQRIFLSDILLDSIEEVIEDQTDLNRSTIQYEPGDIIFPKKYIKVLVVDYNKPVFEVFRKKLKEFEIEVIFHETTNIEYINNHLLNLDVDLVWMFESYNQHQPFKTLDLLTHCKFQEWFSDFEDARAIVEDINYRPHESLKSVCHSFLRKVELMKYMIPIFIHRKEVIIPETMKNLIEQPYGTIDFRRIINDKQE